MADINKKEVLRSKPVAGWRGFIAGIIGGLSMPSTYLAPPPRRNQSVTDAIKNNEVEIVGREDNGTDRIVVVVDK